MYKIDPTQNRIAPLEAKRFGELGFTDLEHELAVTVNTWLIISKRGFHERGFSLR